MVFYIFPKVLGVELATCFAPSALRFHLATVTDGSKPCPVQCDSENLEGFIKPVQARN